MRWLATSPTRTSKRVSRAAQALLTALKIDFDPSSVDHLAEISTALSERDRGVLAPYLTLAAEEDALWDFLLREAHFTLARLLGEVRTLAS